MLTSRVPIPGSFEKNRCRLAKNRPKELTDGCGFSTKVILFSLSDRKFLWAKNLTSLEVAELSPFHGQNRIGTKMLTENHKKVPMGPYL